MDSVASVMTKWVAPLFGVVMANIMFATPMSAVLKARKDESLGSLNPIPWPAITGNCIAWIGYSYFKGDWFVFCANQPGFLMGMFYSLTAVGLAPRKTKDQLITIFQLLSLVLPSCGVVLSVALGDSVSHKKKTFIWGLLCNLILVIYYSAPLSTLVHVVKTKSAASLHWPSCLMNFCNSTCWIAYGAAIQDYFILSPNAAGMVLSLIQLCLILVYKGKGEDNKTFFMSGNADQKDNEGVARTNSKDRLFDPSKASA